LFRGKCGDSMANFTRTLCMLGKLMLTVKAIFFEVSDFQHTQWIKLRLGNVVFCGEGKKANL